MSILLFILGIYVLGMFAIGLPMGIWSLKVQKRRFWENPTRSFLLNFALFPETTRYSITTPTEIIYPPSLPFIDNHGTPWSDRAEDVLNRGRYVTLTMLCWPGRILWNVVVGPICVFLLGCYFVGNVVPTLGARALSKCRRCLEI